MATDVAQNLADNIMGTNSPEVVDLRSPSLDTLTRHLDSNSQNHLQPQLSYVWTTDDSVFSSDVDRWIGGDRASPVNTGVQPSRIISPQRPGPSPPQTPSMDANGFWFLAALVLPLFSLGGTRHWRCTPSTILNTAELLLTQIARYCGRARSHLRRMTREHAAQDVFASAMDVILVIYALGFLLLSMYQASVFQPI